MLEGECPEHIGAGVAEVLLYRILPVTQQTRDIVQSESTINKNINVPNDYSIVIPLSTHALASQDVVMLCTNI